MQSLSLIVLAAVSFGALALSGCSSCSQQPKENRGTEVTKEKDMTCTSTQRGGKECVPNK
jgi:outer membrane murein-binding lipoprotein Lpp